MKRSIEFLFSAGMCAMLLYSSEILAQRIVVPTPGVSGAMAPIVIAPAPPLTLQRIIIYQHPETRNLVPIVVPPPPPPIAHEAPHVHLDHCRNSCLSQCRPNESWCRTACEQGCK